MYAAQNRQKQQQQRKKIGCCVIITEIMGFSSNNNYRWGKKHKHSKKSRATHESFLFEQIKFGFSHILFCQWEKSLFCVCACCHCCVRKKCSLRIERAQHYPNWNLSLHTKWVESTIIIICRYGICVKNKPFPW